MSATVFFAGMSGLSEKAWKWLNDQRPLLHEEMAVRRMAGKSEWLPTTTEPVQHFERLERSPRRIDLVGIGFVEVNDYAIGGRRFETDIYFTPRSAKRWHFDPIPILFARLREGGQIVPDVNWTEDEALEHLASLRAGAPTAPPNPNEPVLEAVGN